MASRSVAKPSFLEQVAALKKACEASMAEDGSGVKGPQARVVPTDFDLRRTPLIPEGQSVDEEGLLRLREIDDAMQHLGTQLLALVDDESTHELLKHHTTEPPSTLLKNALHELLNK